VYALLLPPFSFRKAEKEFSSGNFSVPRKHMCSQKCARPSTSPSLKDPTLTCSAAAAMSVRGSLHTITRRPFASVRSA
jgi:hypothetical protein